MNLINQKKSDANCKNQVIVSFYNHGDTGISVTYTNQSVIPIKVIENTRWYQSIARATMAPVN